MYISVVQGMQPASVTLLSSSFPNNDESIRSIALSPRYDINHT